MEIFDKNYNGILNDSKWQSCSVANDSKSYLAPAMFSLKDSDIAINKLIKGKGFDHVHSLHFKHVKAICRNLRCKLINKILSHTNIPPDMPKVVIQPTVKSTSGNTTASQNFRLVMSS